METLPTLFKQAREKKGISLKDAETATRIPPRYLEVLEGRGDRRLLADYAYLIPFVRTYATFLGLDPTTAVTRFIAELQGLESKEIQSERSAPPTRSSPWTLPLLSLLILLVVFVYLWQRDEPHSRTPEQVVQEEPLSPPLSADGSPQERSAEFSVSTPASSPPTTSEEPSTPASSGETEIAKATIPQEPPSSASLTQSTQSATVPESQASPSPADTSHLLRVEAKEPTWIRVVIDNQQQKDILLQPGEKVEWTAKGGFNLTVGNAGGITLNLNGQDLPPLGKSGQVLRNIQLPATGSSASFTLGHRSSISA